MSLELGGGEPAVQRVGAISSTSSTPAAAAMVRTASMIRCRMSGLRIGGSGIEMSSNAMVSRMPGLQQLGQRVVAVGVEQRVRGSRPSTSRIRRAAARAGRPPGCRAGTPRAGTPRPRGRRAAGVRSSTSSTKPGRTSLDLAQLGSNATFTVPSRPAEWA